jgi:hypothetical protein
LSPFSSNSSLDFQTAWTWNWPKRASLIFLSFCIGLLSNKSLARSARTQQPSQSISRGKRATREPDQQRLSHSTSLSSLFFCQPDTRRKHFIISIRWDLVGCYRADYLKHFCVLINRNSFALRLNTGKRLN